jgi:Phage terminase large subunit
MTTATADRVEHRYRPVGSAAELFASRAPEVLLSGAAGTGKSRACLEKLHFMALGTPGVRGLICRKTATSLAASALVTFEQHVAPEALENGDCKFFGGSPREAPCYRYGNGSVLVVGGMDKASRIMSTEYDVIYVQEATELTEDDWEALTTRLRNGKVSFQQLMADCNPGPPQHWLNKRCQRGACQMILCRHEDNPKLWDGSAWTEQGQAYMSVLDNLTGVRYQRLRRGIWAAAEGLVYGTFDPAIHMRDAIGRPPDNWPRYLSVDLGYINPTVVQFWCVDPDGRLIMYREIYMSHRIVEDHASDILRAVKRGDGHKADVWPPVAVITDHDAEDRATLERKLGVTTVPANKTVSEGIQAVAERLKVQPDGRPRLYLCRDALVERDQVLEDAKRPVCTADEIVEYVWNPAMQPGTDTPRETPRKQNDHGMDAMRYMVAELDLRGRPRMRWLR